MNTIDIQIEVEDKKLLNTLYQTILVEMEATDTDRGKANVSINGSELIINIEATDYIAARALTNSILRLVKASVDVADTIQIKSDTSE